MAQQKSLEGTDNPLMISFFIGLAPLESLDFLASWIREPLRFPRHSSRSSGSLPANVSLWFRV